VTSLSYTTAGSGWCSSPVTSIADCGVCGLVLSTCYIMCSRSINSSMLFLLLRTTLLIVTTCVATMYGAPVVQSDTQAMVRKFSLTFGNKSYSTCRI
jgi:hypothetical protein